MNISVLKNLICLSENYQHLEIGVLLKYIFIHEMNLRVYGRPAGKWHFARAARVKLFHEFSLQFQSASCFRICFSSDRIN